MSLSLVNNRILLFFNNGDFTDLQICTSIWTEFTLNVLGANNDERQ